jgi:hypothetical protein
VTLQIPPGDGNYEVRARRRIRTDMLLVSMLPHMHLRGKDFRFELEYPDGQREVLLDVPRYDFNWQLRYDLAEPKLMPKGSKLHCVAHFDNSANNPFNPDPSAEVEFGIQTWEEMMVGFFTAAYADEDLTRDADAKPDDDTAADFKAATGGE